MLSSIVLRIYERSKDTIFFFFFQRAYSLPARTHTPSSQNRINLRRCVRREPPPHPARLRKHRHGWTLHLEHPLEASKCTRSLVLLIVLLLGVGAVALYIALGKWYIHDKLKKSYVRLSSLKMEGNFPKFYMFSVIFIMFTFLKYLRMFNERNWILNCCISVKRIRVFLLYIHNKKMYRWCKAMHIRDI